MKLILDNEVVPTGHPHIRIMSNSQQHGQTRNMNPNAAMQGNNMGNKGQHPANMGVRPNTPHQSPMNRAGSGADVIVPEQPGNGIPPERQQQVYSHDSNDSSNTSNKQHCSYTQNPYQPQLQQMMQRNHGEGENGAGPLSANMMPGEPSHMKPESMEPHRNALSLASNPSHSNTQGKHKMQVREKQPICKYPRLDGGQEWVDGQPGGRLPAQQHPCGLSAYGQPRPPYPFNETPYMQPGSGGSQDMNEPCPQRPEYNSQPSHSQNNGLSGSPNHSFPHRQQQQFRNPNSNLNNSSVPTSTMTPGSSPTLGHSIHPSEGPGDITPDLADVPPIVIEPIAHQTPVSSPNGPGGFKELKTGDELRLTLPCGDGMVLPLFGFGHNVGKLKSVFHVTDVLYQMSKLRSGL